MTRIPFLFLIASHTLISQTQFQLPLSVGDQWFYRHSTSTSSWQGCSVRTIVDTTATGWREVEVTFYRDMNYQEKKTEYWYYSAGKFFSNSTPLSDPNHVPGYHPLYVSSVITDSSDANVRWYYQQVSCFGENQNSQVFEKYNYMGGNGSLTIQYRITDTYGLSEMISNYLPLSGTPRRETMSLVGIIRNNVLLGDSANHVLSVDDKSIFPSSLALYQNYPNPFNPTTTISYRIPSASFVSLRVFNVLGEEVALLVHSYQNVGEHEVMFDASPLSGGLYFYRLRSNGNAVFRKCLYLK